MGVLAERKFRVAVPKLSGDPPQALPGGKGAGGIGMARAVQSQWAHAMSIPTQSDAVPGPLQALREEGVI